MPGSTQPTFRATRPALRRKVSYYCQSVPLDGGEFGPRREDLMTASATNKVKALGIAAIGVVICAVGIYIGDTDDAPGAALMGIALMIGAMALAVKTARRKT
jgi:hypothetical protein